MPVDYSKFDAVDDSSDGEDEGAIICVPSIAGGGAIYRQRDLKTEQPWRQQSPHIVVPPRQHPDSAAVVEAAPPAEDAVSGRTVSVASTSAKAVPACEASEAASAAATAAAATDRPCQLSFAEAATPLVALNTAKMRLRVDAPTFEFDPSFSDNGQHLFACTCTWSVRGTSLHAQSPPLTSKKTAKGAAAEAMLRECMLREVLVLVEEL
jgi:hypothetical protein